MHLHNIKSHTSTLLARANLYLHLLITIFSACSLAHFTFLYVFLMLLYAYVVVVYCS